MKLSKLSVHAVLLPASRHSDNTDLAYPAQLACKRGNYGFTKMLLRASGRANILGERVSLSPMPVQSWPTVIRPRYIYNERVLISRVMIRIYLGQGVRLEFPHLVRFSTDSCLGCRSMIPGL